ncbi:MAG: hypothetical protein K0S39_6326, partial [Paenibacillus sp.]|nr:hypothetical protein [Paenibacillus sp.]
MNMYQFQTAGRIAAGRSLAEQAADYVTATVGVLR